MTALNSSVVVPALIEWHEAHDPARLAAAGASVPAHALIESYAVLTRLPGPHRLSPEVAAELLDAWFPPDLVLHPKPSVAAGLPARLAAAGISGGATYDALVGLTAAEEGLELRTRDRRAEVTYKLLGIPYALVG